MTLNCANFPAECTAGLSFQAKASYTTPGWALTAHLRGPAPIDLQADASGVFAATAATTKEWPPGTYWWEVRATKGDDAVKVDGGQLVVHPDMTAVGAGFDGRTENERALDAINAVLAKKATQDQMRYTIRTPSGERELWRTPVADLLTLKAHYVAAVRRERNAKAGRTGFGRIHKVTFK